MIDNSERAIELRRNQNALTVYGTGILTFAVWNLAKAVGMITAQRQELILWMKELAGEAAKDVPDSFVFGVVIFVTAVVLLLDFIIRAYVARSAVAESRGKRRSILYLIFSGLIIASSLYSIVMYFSGSGYGDYYSFFRDRSIASLLIETTQAVLMTEMIVASARVRRLSGRGKHSKE